MAESDHDLARIHALATAMRAAFETADPDRLSYTLKRFPRGACGDSSLLLAHLLETHGLGVFGYMKGQRGEWTHCWLQRDDLVVDITADQFDDGPGPVIVSSGSIWHRGFAGERAHDARLAVFGSRWEHDLHRQYQYVRGLIPESALTGL